MSIPDVYLIGAPKSGTTSLARWLADHPDLYFSVPKEPFYWAADYPRLRAHYGFDSRDSYETLFSSAAAACAVRRAEGSTVYLYSERAVPDILAVAADPRFVVALRNPVDLLVSYHRTQLVALNEDEPDFGTAWRRSLRGVGPSTDPLDPKLVDYQLVGRLGHAVERLLTVVPRDRVHVVMFDDLARDPGRTWSSLTDFLGIATDPPPAFEVHNASTKTYRSAVLRRLTHRPPALLDAAMRRTRQWSRTTSLAWVGRLKMRMWRAEDRPSVTEAVRREVADHLASDTMVLASVLRRDLSAWRP